MLESLLFNAEKKTNLLRIFVISFAITLTLSIANYFIGGNSLFLVSFVSLALSYPIVNYIRQMTADEIEEQLASKHLLKRHEKELGVFWAIFIGVLAGFIVTNPLISDYTFQKQFVDSLSGDIINDTKLFEAILLNNTEVFFVTFILSILVFSSLIFVLVWNISIISYYISTLSPFSSSLTTILLLLPHGLLEIGGYVFAGIAGSLVSYRIDRLRKFNHKLNNQFFKDISMLLILGIILVLFGAVVEVL